MYIRNANYVCFLPIGRLTKTLLSLCCCSDLLKVFILCIILHNTKTQLVSELQPQTVKEGGVSLAKWLFLSLQISESRFQIPDSKAKRC